MRYNFCYRTDLQKPSDKLGQDLKGFYLCLRPRG